MHAVVFMAPYAAFTPQLREAKFQQVKERKTSSVETRKQAAC